MNIFLIIFLYYNYTIKKNINILCQTKNFTPSLVILEHIIYLLTLNKKKLKGSNS